jgi:hypothetical protein
MVDGQTTYEDQREQPSQRSSPWPWVVLAIFLTPLLILVILAVITLGGISATWHTVNNLLAGRMIIKPDQPSVIVEVRKLGRLETASYTVEKVIEGGDTRGNPILDALLGDRLLFIAHGDVIAGVDLSNLTEQDVSISSDGRSVTVRLPPAQILSHRLDNDLSRVYDRSTGLLTKGDPNLETRVRQEAERQILAAACQGGILDRARENAQSQVQTLLQLTNFSAVTFLPPSGNGTTGCEDYLDVNAH